MWQSERGRGRMKMVLRWGLTSAATFLISRWLSDTLAEWPRVRRAHATEEEVGITPAGYARLAATWPISWLYGKLAARAVRVLAATEATPDRPRHVLDIGCGPGTVAVALAHRAPGTVVLGLDPSPGMLRVAQQYVDQQSLTDRVHLIQGDGAAVPLRGGGLDLVIATLALHHWHDGEAVLREVRRLLSATGRLLLFDLRRDVSPPLWVLVSLASLALRLVTGRQSGEPAASIAAAYAPAEAEWLAGRAKLAGVYARAGPAWLWLEGTTHANRDSRGPR